MKLNGLPWARIRNYLPELRCFSALLVSVLALVACEPVSIQQSCQPGVYVASNGNFVVLAQLPSIPAPALRYLFRDGRRGATSDAVFPLICEADSVVVSVDSDQQRWVKVAFRETPTTFDNLETKLGGMLIEPLGVSDPARPLVVMVHGSERTPAISSDHGYGSIYAYALAAQGISVFVYDKRGTGSSDGEYTQSFELLADDAVAALNQARRMMSGRFGRVGFLGGSQGGWVAPLAATLAPADFVAVGFGLVASPIEEDREQLVSEVRAAGLGEDAESLVNRLSQATAKLLLSEFEQGYDDLNAVRQAMAGKPWAEGIEGEYSGAIMRLGDEELRRVGRPRFDNLELIWNYDAVAALRRLDAPLLWVLAGEDREAPIETTHAALLGLAAEGKPVDVYLFPETDHGMFEFTTNVDGSRSITRITDGYLKLLGDWIRGDVADRYGRAEHLTAKSR